MGRFFRVPLRDSASLAAVVLDTVAMAGAGLLAVLIDRLAFKPLRSLTVGGLVLWGGSSCFSWEWSASGRLRSRSQLPLRLLWSCWWVCGRLPHDPALAPGRGPAFSADDFIDRGHVHSGQLGYRAVRAQVSRFPLNLFPLAPYHVTKDAVISPIQALVLGLSLALMLTLNLLIKRTQMGRAIRAIAWNERTSRLLGINVDFVIAQTFFISGALAGAAGVLLGLAFNRLEPTMGHEVELAGLTVIIVGGMGSIGGAALAAFLVGMIRVLSVAYVDSSFRDAFVFALLILVLLVRPSGIFGRSKTVRA